MRSPRVRNGNIARAFAPVHVMRQIVPHFTGDFLGASKKGSAARLEPPQVNQTETTTLMVIQRSLGLTNYGESFLLLQRKETF